MALTAFAECDTVQRMAGMTAATRFILRVQEYIDRGVRQKDLRGSNSEGWISNILKARRSLKLDDAESIANALEVPLAELLRRADSMVYELDNLESRLIEAFRLLTRQEQDALITVGTMRQRPGTPLAGRLGQRHRPPRLSWMNEQDAELVRLLAALDQRSKESLLKRVRGLVSLVQDEADPAPAPSQSAEIAGRPTTSRARRGKS